VCVFLSVSPVSWFVEETADAEFNQVYDILIHKTPQAELCTGVMLHTVFFCVCVVYVTYQCISCGGHQHMG